MDELGRLIDFAHTLDEKCGALRKELEQSKDSTTVRDASELREAASPIIEEIRTLIEFCPIPGRTKHLHELPNGADWAPRKPEVFYKLEKRMIRPGYSGLFALEPIKKGAVIGKTGGPVVSSASDTPPGLDFAALIGEGRFLVPESYANPSPLCFLNHSCDPNVARYGGLILASKKGIPAGTELTIDYSPLVGGMTVPWEMPCTCDAPNCRGRVSTEDWKDPEISSRLWPEWLPFVQKKIQELRSIQ